MLALSSAQSAGATFGKEVTATALADGQPQAVLDFIWQVVNVGVLAKVSVRNQEAAYLLRLAQAEESATDLLALEPEALILRWLNYHLAHAVPAACRAAPVTSTGAGLADGVALAALVRTLAPDYAADVPADDDAAVAAGAEATVTAVRSTAFALGVPACFSVEGITTANQRLQLAFLAFLLRACPGLEPPVAAVPAAALARPQP